MHAGPFVSALTAVFGMRAVIMAGALLSAAGIGLSSLVTEIWHLYITFGLLAGRYDYNNCDLLYKAGNR